VTGVFFLSRLPLVRSAFLELSFLLSPCGVTFSLFDFFNMLRFLKTKKSKQRTQREREREREREELEKKIKKN